jgi:hypothetical protein
MERLADSNEVVRMRKVLGPRSGFRPLDRYGKRIFVYAIPNTVAAVGRMFVGDGFRAVMISISTRGHKPSAEFHLE